jgi:hypothetical protein
MKKVYQFCLFLCIIFLVGACKKNNAVALSSQKEVASFTASNSGLSSMPVTINNDKHTIAIMAQCPTFQDAITVKPVVSDKSTCSLASGTVLDLRSTKKFTITAEDGTKQEYSVFVQGCTLYSSFFYKLCNEKRAIPCIIQNKTKFGVNGNTIFLSFTSLPESGTTNFFDENDFRVGITLANTDFKTGASKTYNIDPYNGVGSKAYFAYNSSSFGGLQPLGTLNITHVDIENKLISGNFNFEQKGDGNGLCTKYDYILGEFYSVPY